MDERDDANLFQRLTRSGNLASETYYRALTRSLTEGAARIGGNSQDGGSGSDFANLNICGHSKGATSSETDDQNQHKKESTSSKHGPNKPTGPCGLRCSCKCCKKDKVVLHLDKDKDKQQPPCDINFTMGRIRDYMDKVSFQCECYYDSCPGGSLSRADRRHLRSFHKGVVAARKTRKKKKKKKKTRKKKSSSSDDSSSSSTSSGTDSEHESNSSTEKISPPTNVNPDPNTEHFPRTGGIQNDSQSSTSGTRYDYKASTSGTHYDYRASTSGTRYDYRASTSGHSKGCFESEPYFQKLYGGISQAKCPRTSCITVTNPYSLGRCGMQDLFYSDQSKYSSKNHKPLIVMENCGSPLSQSHSLSPSSEPLSSSRSSSVRKHVSFGGTPDTGKNISQNAKTSRPVGSQPRTKSKKANSRPISGDNVEGTSKFPRSQQQTLTKEVSDLSVKGKPARLHGKACPTLTEQGIHIVTKPGRYVVRTPQDDSYAYLLNVKPGSYVKLKLE